VPNPDLHIRPAARRAERETGPLTFTDRTLSGRVVLDNSRFVGCRFKGATLIYTGGVAPQIQGCAFEEVSFEFHGAAGRTLALLQAMGAASSGLRDIVKASFGSIFGH
jgi:hypothetical protein